MYPSRQLRNVLGWSMGRALNQGVAVSNPAGRIVFMGYITSKLSGLGLISIDVFFVFFSIPCLLLHLGPHFDQIA